MLDQAAYDELRATVERLQTDIGAELAHLRQRLADEILSKNAGSIGLVPMVKQVE